MTDLQMLRLKLGDDISSASDKVIADGEMQKAKLSHGHIVDGTLLVYIDDELQAAPANYTFDLLEGSVLFNIVPDEGKTIKASYQFSAFTDSELQELLDDSNGDVTGAIIQAIHILLADYSRKFDYSTGQQDMKPSQVFQNLRQLLEIYSSKSSNEAASIQMVDRTSKYYDSCDDTDFIGAETPQRKSDFSRYDEGW